MNRTFLLLGGTVAGCALALVVGCGASEDDHEQRAAPPSAALAGEHKPAPGAQPGIALPGAAKHSSGSAAKIGVKLPQSTVAAAQGRGGKARRIALQPPLVGSSCSDSALGGIAIADGAAYVIEHGVGVRRYKMGETWTLDTSFGEAGILANPTVAPIAQTVGKGQFYARSGDAKYQFARGPKHSVYIYDFIDGIHRIAGSAAFATCTNVPGIHALTWQGQRAFAWRGGKLFEVRASSKACKLVAPRELPVRVSSLIASDGDLYLGGVDNGRKYRLVKLARGNKPAFIVGNDDAFADDGLCHSGAIAAHGSNVCVVDGNCNKLVCFRKTDGSLAASLKTRALFGGNPYKVQGIESHADSLYFAVTLRDRAGDTCQPAIFKLGSNWGHSTGG